MNLSIQYELQPFAEELQRYIIPEFLEELAREMKFVKRKRKFLGSDLSTICIWITQRVAIFSIFKWVLEKIMIKHSEQNVYVKNPNRVFFPKSPKWGNKTMLFRCYTQCQKVALYDIAKELEFFISKIQLILI